MQLKNIFPLFVFFMFLSVTTIYASGTKNNSSIVKNELVLKSDSDQYTEVRHIILKRSDEKIGQALTKIAIKDYNAYLNKYTSPLYAKAQLEYMKTNYPYMCYVFTD
jgi:hypothetical protein